MRADPNTNTISLLSLPRDLDVPVYCPRSARRWRPTRIDYAFAYCGPAGSLDTVKKLTGLRINYLITVDFNGFKGSSTSSAASGCTSTAATTTRTSARPRPTTRTSTCQPGYQRLSGGSALEFVRYRHTDSDFYRHARQQEFLRALKDQVKQNFDPFELPEVVSAITHNVASPPASRA